ncbi:MAG: hypothetical protein DMF87_11665 [Acidobacteria bacterium]|nr:MAG: hypothetical protein DMF87_11665 [Acidobacteriota bacterium]
MRVIATATVLVLGLTTGLAEAQYMPIPKTFQPSLEAAKKREAVKTPPLTAATPVKDTLYRIGDALGMLRDIEERDSVLTLDFKGTGTLSVGGVSCTLANFRGQLRYSVPAMRIDFACAEPDGKPGQRHVQVIANAMAWDEARPGGAATPMPDAVTDRLMRLWALPQSVYKAAVIAGDKAKTTLENGVLYLTYPLPAPLNGTARVALNTTDAIQLTMDTGEKYQLSYWIDRVELRVGNRVEELTYTDYAELNEPDYRSEVMFPRHIVEKRDGMVVADLTTQRTNTYNPYVVMPLPVNVKEAYPASAATAVPAAIPAGGGARGGGAPPAAAAAKVATPRTADGHPDLNGRWGGGAGGAVGTASIQGLDKSGNRVTFASLEDAKASATKIFARNYTARHANPTYSERDQGMTDRYRDNLNPPLYKAEFWDRVQYLDMHGNYLDTAFLCAPVGLPRIGAPVRIIQSPTEVVFLYNNRNMWRVVPTDGRPHGKEDDRDQTYMGDSIGHWEGDTLVVEAVGFNDDTWLANVATAPGWFHTTGMRVVETFRRDGNTLYYGYTVYDPDVLAEPWVVGPRAIQLNTTNGPYNEDPPCIMNTRPMVSRERG